MILVSEILKLPAILLITIAVITELCLLIYIQLNFKQGYSILFEPAKEIAIKKANLTTIKFNEIIKNGIYRYYSDLKVIGRHMSKLILEGNDSDSINKNSNFYKNYADSKNKTIIFSNLQTLSSVS